MTPANDPFAAYRPAAQLNADQPTAAQPDTTSPEERTATNRKVAVLIGGTTLVGASLAGLAWGMSRSNPDETSVTTSVRDEDLRIDQQGTIRPVPDSAAAPAEPVLPAPGPEAAAVPTVNVADTDVRQDADDALGQKFMDAFREAREDLGAGKFFIWHENLYSTNYKEEWDAKPLEEQQSFYSGMGLAAADLNPEPAIDLPEEMASSGSAAQLTASVSHPREAEAEDGIPVSIEELKNAELSSDKITIVDAVAINDDNADVPVQVQLKDDQASDDEWIKHDLSQLTDSHETSHAYLDQSEMDMPHYDSSLTDDFSDDDDQHDA